MYESVVSEGLNPPQERFTAPVPVPVAARTDAMLSVGWFGKTIWRMVCRSSEEAEQAAKYLKISTTYYGRLGTGVPEIWTNICCCVCGYSICNLDLPKAKPRDYYLPDILTELGFDNIEDFRESQIARY